MASRDETAPHEVWREPVTHPVWRWVCLAALGTVAVLGLLNVFGQKTRTVEAASTNGFGGTFTVTVPERLRSGLIYQATFDINAGEDGIAKPRLVFSHGWADGSTLNSAMPEPGRQLSATDTGNTVWIYRSVPPGGRLKVVTSWQVDPTGPASRELVTVLSDGDRELARYENRLEVFP